MAADKVYRILSMYKHMLDGGIIDKNEAAERYDVNVRSILRDIADIREFMEIRSLQTGDDNTVIYDSSHHGYKLKNVSATQLGKDE